MANGSPPPTDAAPAAKDRKDRKGHPGAGAAPPDSATAALTGALQQLRTDVVGVVSQLAQDRALGAHRDELRAALGVQVEEAAARLRGEVGGLLDARGEDLTLRLTLVDALLRDLSTRLTEGAGRLDEVDRRLSPAHVGALVEQAAQATADTVYEQRFQAGVDALTEAFGEADDRLAQLRAFVDTFGPGGLPVVAQERDTLQARVGALQGALDAAQEEILALKGAVADRDAAALRRRVVEGIDPEVLDRRLAAVAERERELDARETLATDNERLTTEIERLRAGLERWETLGRAEQTARVDAAQLQQFRASAEEADRARTVAERQLGRARFDLAQAEDARDSLASQLRALEQDRAASAERLRRLEALTAENRSFHRQFEEQKRLQSDHERLLRDAEVERSNLTAEILALQREVGLAKVAGQRAEAQARAEELRARQAELDEWAEAEAASRAQGHRAKAKLLTEQNEALRTQLAARQAEVEGLIGLEQKARAAQKAAEVQLASLREVHDKRLALLEAEVRASEARMLAAAQAHAAKVLEEAEQQADRIRHDAEADARRNRDEANAEANRLTELADEAQALHNRLIAEIEERSAFKGELDAQIERLKLDLWELKQRVVPAEERIKSLEDPVFAADDLRPAAPRDEEEVWLGALQSGIESAGFVFHPRLVRAFHTSLKIAHHAPLVVLAGISGTGKSELPRLYADLGGLPFLPLAVQPSWDSPHDLFGFFNYTDGRLKAEPLARLFRQVSKADDELQKSPSLVLLDEMNLARVEYYFADLLSKLEARRSVRGSDDPARRKRASVLVDTGPEGGELPLYLDERVLFVGTMNQDESTLTLSDKVLDRACVLTFPAPRRMHLTTQPETPRRNERLGWATWESWLREPTAGDNEDKLNEVNRAMADLGRPFGHRLFRAIHAYVENYPGSKDDAFADQFAMKILPRLGGLECGSSRVRTGLDRLASLVPTELTTAYASSRDHEFFTWGGAPDLYQVDRS